MVSLVMDRPSGRIELSEEGGACGANPIAITIPCHRVVCANGWRGGLSGSTGVTTKQTLLAIETEQGRMSWPEATS